MGDLTTYELDDGIATIEMDDGKVNALGIPMLRELHAAFDRAEADDAIVILTGREGRFSAGFDLKIFRETPEQLGEMLTLGATLCERILAFPRPVVTACTGHAVAAGCFIQLPADLRLGVDGSFQIGLNGGEDRPDDAAVRDRAGPLAPHPVALRPRGQQRGHVRADRRRRRGVPRPHRPGRGASAGGRRGRPGARRTQR